MTTIFDSLTSSRLDDTKFSFYNDGEIQKMSVKEINNPMAYDELNNPTSNGIWDEAMGVSALDRFRNERHEAVTALTVQDIWDT